MKEPVQIDFNKTFSLTEQTWISHSADIFAKYIVTPFHDTALSINSLEYIGKPEVSWCFQGA